MKCCLSIGNRLKPALRSVLSIFLVCIAGLQLPMAYADPEYDVVLKGGRVVDPESGFDKVAYVGIKGSKIARISRQSLDAKKVVDVTGLVVSPGFINVHSHSWTPLGQEFEILDGVTTALELEAGAYPADTLGTYDPIKIEGHSRLNFGASIGHAFLRAKILDQSNAITGMDEHMAKALLGNASAGMDSAAFTSTLDSKQIEILATMLREELARNAGIGIGMLLDYMSEVVSDEEMATVFDIAGETGAPIFVHIRRGVAGDPSGLKEVINYAKKFDAQLHICHIQASAMSNIKEFLQLIRTAKAEGVKITTESFPYNAGSTSNTAAVFSRDWRTIFAIDYSDVELASTGERFTEESWNYHREHSPGAGIIHHYNKEEWTSVATNDPEVIVASDGLPIFSLEAKVTPFGIGTNAKILGRYVREKGSLSLVNALRKMTLLPANMLERYNSSFKKKGRLQEGMDADITIFDPKKVIDRATYGDPYQHSIGIQHVLVNGQFSVQDGKLVADAFPGLRVQRQD